MSIHLFSVVRLSTTAALALGLCVLSPESASAVSPDTDSLAVQGTASTRSIESDVVGQSATSATTSEAPSTTAFGASFDTQAEHQFGVCEDVSDGTRIAAMGPNSELPRCNSVIPNLCPDPYDQKWCACRAGMGMTSTYECGCKTVSLPDPGEVEGEFPIP